MSSQSSDTTRRVLTLRDTCGEQEAGKGAWLPPWSPALDRSERWNSELLHTADVHVHSSLESRDM